LLPEGVERQFTTLSTAVSKTATGLSQLQKSTTAVASDTDRLSLSVENAIGKLIKYRLSYLILRKAMEGLKESINIFEEIDYEMAQLAKVADPVTTSLADMKKAAFEFGKEFNLSAQSVLKAFNIWARMGLTQAEILEATRTTLIGVNAIGLDTVEMTQALTSVMYTYGIQAKDTLQIINEWMRVQAKFPVDAKDLANSLQLIGSAALEVGVNLEQLGGYVTAINAITRKSGQAIGQSLKTIFVNMQRPEALR
jgi:TP901 family phage tail tape measure protein